MSNESRLRGAPTEATGATGNDLADPLDRQNLDLLRNLRDGESLLGTLIRSFLAASAADLDAVRQGAEAGRWSAVGIAAHRLGGSSGVLGAVEVAAVCRAIEERLRAGRGEELVALVARLGRELERARAALETMVHESKERIHPMTDSTIARPEETEHLPYYGKYISLVPDGDILALLGGQIEATSALLRSVPESRAGFRYAPDKWSIRQVVGHLIDAERIFVYRALCFARDDRTPLPGFEENAYVRNAGFDDCPLSGLAAELESVRRSTLFFFKHLGPQAWLRGGLANGAGVSVRALAYIIAGHELHHREILRSRYLEG